ncbi:WapI family immunity protein [Motilibacter deserti]|uniref:Uncharacterized protein n=1 Tax=Motilibacter deserti TaxID=2714956 RepID=A0ABX0GZX4_9ACTN|nr:hypothetical protein [Motilibacter deserti]NHC16372.1 hypothetical protein [Motilibacter deserti]
MLLISRDGAALRLVPTRYQFGFGASHPGDWDANWLVVHGEVRTSSGGSWSFEDPCLTTWEAVELGQWLASAAAGAVVPTVSPDEQSEGVLSFTEPNLAFSVAEIDDLDLVVRVHLAFESASARLKVAHDLIDQFTYHVAVLTSRRELDSVAASWLEELESFPQR